MSNFEANDFYVYACTDCLSVPLEPNIEQKIFVPDLTRGFLKNVMLYMDRAVREDLMNAIAFFKRKFGLDFTNQCREIEPSWCITGASLYPFTWPCDIQTELVLTNCGRTTGQVNDGGWAVQVVEPGVVGLLNDKPHYFKPNTYFFFGYQKIISPDGTSHTFHYRSLEPLHFNHTSCPSAEEATLRFQICNLCNRRWGLALGTITFTNQATNNTLFHYRLVINFTETGSRTYAN